MSRETLVFNGINGATGRYLTMMTPREISRIARGQRPDPPHDRELRRRADTRDSFGVRAGVDPHDLAQAGWGVIFSKDCDPAVHEALEELLAHRKRQAMGRYREIYGEEGYRPGESKREFLARHGVGAGPADPAKVPYYLLLVGDPESIPYDFQYQLGVQYAVGRIHFETADEYAAYARSVVAAERGQLSLPPRVTFFGTRNPGDRATELSSEYLVKPLAEFVAEKHPKWKVCSYVGEEATKARLTRLMGGEKTPALLFLAGHGVGFPKDDPRQLSHQGAFLCQDWPGPKARDGSSLEKHYFAARDLGEEADVRGLLVFYFGCYGGGTPRSDAFPGLGKAPAEVAAKAFVAALPQRLLAHPKGGALAVVAHVERCWGYSFLSVLAGTIDRQLLTFESALTTLLDGHPVGAAMEDFSQRYSDLSTDLTETLEQVSYGLKVDDEVLSAAWTARNDARSYVILGDPAVRLAAIPEAG